jgi:hypothetical protein
MPKPVIARGELEALRRIENASPATPAAKCLPCESLAASIAVIADIDLSKCQPSHPTSSERNNYFRARGMAEPIDRIDDNTPARASQKPAGSFTIFVLATAALAIIIRAVIADPDSILPFVFVYVFVTIYFLPSIIAVDRKHRQRIAILILNVLLGWAVHGWWTVLGWIIALVWACTATVGAQGMRTGSPDAGARSAARADEAASQDGYHG